LRLEREKETNKEKDKKRKRASGFDELCEAKRDRETRLSMQ
jgi:hypothetical protein